MAPVVTDPVVTTRTEFGLLGPLIASGPGGTPLQLGPAKQRGLLACLLLRPGTVITTRQLIDDVWGMDAPPTAVKMVHVFVSRLRTALGPDGGQLLITRGRGYELRISPDQVDLGRCRVLLSDGLRALAASDPELAVQIFDEALALWRGEPLAELADLPLARAAALEIEELRLSLREARVEAQLLTGDIAAAMGEARRLSEGHPLRERPVEQLMLALFRSGRQVESLEVFADYRRRLAEDSGLEPGPELRELQRRILQQDPTLLPAPRAKAQPTGPTQAPMGGRVLPQRRRAALFVGAAAAVAVVVVMATLLAGGAGRGHSGSTFVTVTANSAVALDSQSGRVLADYRVGTDPQAIAVDEGMIWTANIQDRTISQIAAETGRAVRTYGLSTPALSLAAGEGSVWITHGFTGSLSRILIDYQQLTAPFLPERGSAGLSSIAVTPTAVWATSADRTVVQLDPSTLRVVRTIHLDRTAASIAVTDGAVWTTGFLSSTVEHHQIGAGETLRSTKVVGRARQVIAGNGAVWVTSVAPNTLTRIDPATGKVVSSFALAGAPTAMAVGADRVWVAEGQDGTLQRFDLAGELPPTLFSIGHHIGGLTSAGDRIWLTTN